MANIYISKLNTGKVTFDGIKIKGALGGSSDGESNDTIELVPDTNGYEDDQYLIVEPQSSGTYINIRAGGTIDDSAAPLVIGGLKTYVSLSDQSSNRVVISAKNLAEDGAYTWEFSRTGNMQIPVLQDITDGANNTVTSGGNRIAFIKSTDGKVDATTTNVYVVDTATVPLSMELPDSTYSYIHPGYTFTVIDETGHAGTFNIVITKSTGGTDSIISAPSGVTIDTNYGMICFKYVGNKKWAILYGR